MKSLQRERDAEDRMRLESARWQKRLLATEQRLRAEQEEALAASERLRVASEKELKAKADARLAAERKRLDAEHQERLHQMSTL
eukprot:6002327-Prorocentrum_lima.AAC.1